MAIGTCSEGWVDPMEIRLNPQAIREIEQRSNSFVEDVTQQIADEIRRNAPVDTGELQNSIQAVEGGIEIDSDHWAPVEYGNRKNGVAPNPFIRPAVNKPRRPRGGS